MINLKGKGAFLYVVSYIEGANPNVILPADDPERLAHAERIADAAQAAGLTHVLIKVADGQRPYNVRWKDSNGEVGPKGQVYFNSMRSTAVDDCPLVVATLHRRGIEVYGWQFIYGQNPEAEAEMAIQRIRELQLDGWVVNAEYAHKSYLQNGKVLDGTKIDRTLPAQELIAPPQAIIAKVGRYMAPVRAETLRLQIPLFVSTYKFPSNHPSFPFVAFIEYSDGAMPQVYPIGDTSPIAHAQQLKRSLLEYRAIQADLLIIPTGGAFSEKYYVAGKKDPISWVATPEQVTDFFSASAAEGLPAANFWEWYQARERFPALWDAMSGFTWPGGHQEPAIEVPAQGAGDPVSIDWRTLFNDFRIRIRH